MERRGHDGDCGRGSTLLWGTAEGSRTREDNPPPEPSSEHTSVLLAGMTATGTGCMADWCSNAQVPR